MTLRRSYFAMHRQADAVLAPFDLTANQFVLLSLLNEKDGVPQRDLVERASSDPNTIRPMIQLLESKGYVERHPDPEDGRAWRVSLTRDGKTAYRKVRRRTEKFREELISVFDEEELEVATRLLARIAEFSYEAV